MERRDFLKLSAAAALAAPLARPAIAQTPTTVRWWYHFDNPQNSPAALVAKFEQENPGGEAATTTRPACSPLSWQATGLTPPWCACPGPRASRP